MARIFPIHRTSLAEPAWEDLTRAFAALPEPWLALCDRRLALGDQRADAVLVHPGLGIALVNPVPNHPSAAGALRRLLERAQFGLFFPGELPILALKTRDEDPKTLAGRLQAAFDAAPRLDIEDSDWADAVVELLLEDRDLTMAPIGSHPSPASQTTPASTAATPTELEIPIDPADEPPRLPSFTGIRATAAKQVGLAEPFLPTELDPESPVGAAEEGSPSELNPADGSSRPPSFTRVRASAADRIGFAGPLRLTELDPERPVGGAEEGWSIAQGRAAPAVTRSSDWPSANGKMGRGRLARTALLAAGIVCAAVLPFDLPLLDEAPPAPGKPPTTHEAALPPAADGMREADATKGMSAEPRSGVQEPGTAAGAPSLVAPALPPTIVATQEPSPTKDMAAEPRPEVQEPGSASGPSQAHEFQPILPAPKSITPPRPLVVFAAKPFAAAPPPPPQLTPIEPLPTGTPDSASPTHSPAPGALTATPPAKRDSAPAPSVFSQAPAPPARASDKLPAPHAGVEKPRRVARAQNPEEIRQPVYHATANQGGEGRQPPIDAADLPPLDPPTNLVAPAGPSTALTVEPTDGATGRPGQALAPPVPLTRPRIASENGVGASAPPTGPAQSAAAKPSQECVPYISDKSLFGGRGSVQGIACRDPDGRWRVLSEAPGR
jgi:hypothetical protein